MKAMLLRIWYLIRRRLLLICIPAVLIVCMFPPAGIFLLLFLEIAAGMIPLAVMQDDDISRFEQWKLTLPLPRRVHADAAYLVVLLLSGCLLSVTAVLLSALRTQGFPYYLGLTAAACLLMPAVSLPVAYRFGRIAGCIAAFVIMMAEVTVMPLLIVPFVLSLPAKDAVLVSSTFSCAWYELLPGPAALLLFGISRMISVRILEKKEF